RRRGYLLAEDEAEQTRFHVEVVQGEKLDNRYYVNSRGCARSCSTCLPGGVRQELLDHRILYRLRAFFRELFHRQRLPVQLPDLVPDRLESLAVCSASREVPCAKSCAIGRAVRGSQPSPTTPARTLTGSTVSPRCGSFSGTPCASHESFPI